MGKAKKGSTKAANNGAPKCTCEHPFDCTCGNRPPRPSKGHKWNPETQEWTGKGHKQKGASGQTASKAEDAKTTDKGKTTIAQWQRLPSTLVREHCKREKRPPPKFKNVAKNDGKYLYRVILPDNKDPDKDLFFVPSTPVENEEQAMEEACILALLSQTPNLPHERKLPEPYKTTWLHAIENRKKSSKSKNNTATNNNNNNDDSKTKPPKTNASDGEKGEDSTNAKTTEGNSNKVTIGNGGAQASTSLSLGEKWTSNGEKRRQADDKKRERAKRIRHHEAVRMANKNHPVFLAAHLRQQIQKLLRGDTAEIPDLDDENGEPLEDDEPLDDGKAYVLERLHNEGFTRHQIRAALRASDNANSSNEDQWDKLYEDCLQWLCIHLDEDDLPEGFDPRGGTLDVVVAGKSGSEACAGGQERNSIIAVSDDIASFASKYGLSNKEAKLVADQADNEACSREILLWQAFKELAGVSLDGLAEKSEQNVEATQEEIEALEAIFPTELALKKEEKFTVLTLKLTDIDADLTMQVEIENGVYPSLWPNRLLIFGKWPSSPHYGAAIHVEIIGFLSNLDLGNPMIFELYGHVQSLFHSTTTGELNSVSLLPALKIRKATENTTSKKVTSKQQIAKADNSSGNYENMTPERKDIVPKVHRRPRDRSFFWSTPPSRTPPALSSPKIGKSMELARKSLPAFKAREEFLAALAKAEEGGRVVLVTGDTGCGKTTQIPQFILEEAPADVKIVIAQPRRIAATGVASRVADERGEGQPGKDSVGYVVRGDSAICTKTRMLFCTTGVLLRQLQNEKALENISHIVIDEVHERNLDSDVLLCFLKLTLKDYPHLKVILMSATLDADRFATYWGNNTPRIHIPGRTFPVSDYMLEDVLSLTGYVPPRKQKKKNEKAPLHSMKSRNATPWADSEKSDGESNDEADDHTDSTGVGKHRELHLPSNSIPIQELVERIDDCDLDYDLLARLVRHLVQTRNEDDGSILVFLSGVPEINNAMESLKKVLKNHSVLILPLHGGLQSKDQRRVFQIPENGLMKIILSTNIAESSVTIPDCTIVIDSCREKESSYDPVNRMPLLLEKFASKASLKQRRGRAGRVREGVCYKLISRKTHSKLKEYGDPEVRRCALDQTLLSLLFLGVERGSGTFLRELMDPPSQKSIDVAILSLRKLGAVRLGDTNGAVYLTPLGMHLASIPAPPSLGKLLVMGSILGCRTAALAMAAGMSLGRSPFLRVDAPPKNRGSYVDDEKRSIEDLKKQKVLDERKALFAEVGNSDHSLLAAIYIKWVEASAGGGNRQHLCDSLNLSLSGMRDMMQLVNQYDSSLKAAGYLASDDADRNMRSWRIIRSCVVAALAPSQLVRVVRPSTKYAQTVEGAVERDAVAKELKFFIRPGIEDQGNNSTQSNEQEERVFIHPSSFNFSVGNYSCPWLVYHTLVRTSKPFLRDCSECSAYALLLFGGDLDVQAKEGVVVIDNWVKLEAKARIGSLIGGLRQKIDELLGKKIDDPSFELASTSEMKLIFKLLITDGLG